DRPAGTRRPARPAVRVRAGRELLAATVVDDRRIRSQPGRTHLAAPRRVPGERRPWALAVPSCPHAGRGLRGTAVPAPPRAARPRGPGDPGRRRSAGGRGGGSVAPFLQRAAS